MILIYIIKTLKILKKALPFNPKFLPKSNIIIDEKKGNKTLISRLIDNFNS